MSRALGLCLCLLIAACSDPPHPTAPEPLPPTAQATTPAPPPPAPSAPPAPSPEPAVAIAAVAADCAAAARAGREILAAGGNAADAAVAAMLASGVAQPASSGLGGGGMAIYWSAAERRAVVLDFREVAPTGIRPREHLARSPIASLRGREIGVPGQLAGLMALHRRGRLPREQIFAPAITLASEGFEVNRHTHRSLRWQRHWVLATSAMDHFAPGGQLAEEGDRVRHPALAATLRTLASEGPDAFYRGAIGDELVALARDAGSRITGADLASYRVEERQPIVTEWADHSIYAPPAPSAGGILLQQVLRMYPPGDLKQLGHNSGAYLHVLAESFRGSIDDRMLAIGDPAYIRVDAAALAAPARMRRRRALIDRQVTRPFGAFQLDEGTANVVVVDSEGNAAVVTSSLNDMFGARVFSDSGIVLNNALASFTTPKEEERFGAGRRPNRPKGGARPVTSATPVIVTDGEKVVMAVGAVGGWRMPTAVTQALIGRLAFTRSAAEIASDVRVDVPPTGGLRLDPHASAELVADLAKRGEVVDKDRPSFAAVQLVLRDGETLQAVADPRKPGGAELLSAGAAAAP